MRICSLLPSATEIVFALGLGEQLVGTSHACDYPNAASGLPVVSQSVRKINHLSSAEIDAIIQQSRSNNNPLYWIDGELLRRLRPDLIITQELCEVCAISSGSVFETAAKVLDYQPEILTIRPNTLAEILQNVVNIADAAGVPARGRRLKVSLQDRITHVVNGTEERSKRPRVVCLDWLEPLRNTGQWIPELVELAGGEEGLAVAGERSRELAWSEVVEYAPEYLMVMPCAFEPERVRSEVLAKLVNLEGWRSIPAVKQGKVILFDGRVPTRHGPRVVDVLEGLAEAMIPEKFGGLAPEGIVSKEAFL